MILVGERAAEIPGAFSAVAGLAERTGAKVAWIPRRAGERGALAVGATPNLLPGGRQVANAAARTEVERTWGVEEGTLPATPGRDTTAILEAAANGELVRPAGRRRRPVRPARPARWPRRRWQRPVSS